MRRLKIGILGTRGIPNHYGGFEQIAGHLAKGLVERGHSVTVYNSHTHPYKNKTWNGVFIIHKYDPESWIGTAGQFLYDYNCIIDSRKQDFDIILMLGYTSSSIWGSLYNSLGNVVINMDGIEWKRSKYSPIVKRFLRLAERLGIKYATVHIADSIIIKDYLDNKYGINSKFISYGASIHKSSANLILATMGIARKKFFLLIARMEPENNINMILDGFIHSNSTNKFIVVGDTGNKFGKKMVKQYGSKKSIIFAGPIYDPDNLFSLRSHCDLYFHGHSVGGTNPSLLEAMSAKALIVAHNNPFNESILNGDAFYFNNAADVRNIIERQLPEETISTMINNNYSKIVNVYNWENVIQEYESLFLDIAK